MLDFVTDSEFAVTAALWTGGASLALVFLLMLETLALRLLLIARTRRAERFDAAWNPLLIESLDEVPRELPSVARRDVVSFLLLWNYLQESLRDEAKENLNNVARVCAIDRRALTLLRHRNLRHKLLAVQTLGRLGERRAWGELVELCETDDSALSLSAAKALVRIDAAPAVELIIPMIVRRADWSTSVVAGILREAGADVISAPLARVVLAMPRAETPRMIRFFELAQHEIAAPVVRRILSDSDETEVVTACLRVLQSPEDLPRVRAFLQDERWQIRLHAVMCLGRSGTGEDEAKLAHACGDLEWWVRYRAAQALASLPTMTDERFRSIGEAHQNEFGRDIIRQVTAERQVNS